MIEAARDKDRKKGKRASREQSFFYDNKCALRMEEQGEERDIFRLLSSGTITIARH
jgi:hypothetical protein